MRLVVRGRLLRLLEEVRELLERRLDELRRLPEIRREVRVRFLEGREDCLDEVSARLRVPAGRAVAVRDTSEREHLFVAGAPTTPVPRGAGTRRMRTEPHLP